MGLQVQEPEVGRGKGWDCPPASQVEYRPGAPELHTFSLQNRERIKSCLFKATPFVIICYRDHRKLIYILQRCRPLPESKQRSDFSNSI